MLSTRENVRAQISKSFTGTTKCHWITSLHFDWLLYMYRRTNVDHAHEDHAHDGSVHEGRAHEGCAHVGHAHMRGVHMKVMRTGSMRTKVMRSSVVMRTNSSASEHRSAKRPMIKKHHSVGSIFTYSARLHYKRRHISTTGGEA